jgi:hypothetical protein
MPVIDLDIPVPEQLAATVGLPDTPARFFAIYWHPCGDEAEYSDGRSSGTGNWTGYLAYTRHPAVCLALAPYQLGSSDQEAEHWLLIDRRDRKAHIGPWREVARFLREQWQESVPSGPVVLSEAELAELMRRLDEEFRSRPMPTMEEITARMAEQRRLEEDMVRWLDATPQAAAGREAIRRMVEGDKGAGEKKEEQP